MPRVRVQEPIPPAVTTVVTKTETVEHATPAPEEARLRKPPLDEFMRTLNPLEVENHSFWLYRLEETVTTREGNKYLKRLDAADLNQMNLADFTESLKDWIQNKANGGKGFGGGKFLLKLNVKKTGDNLYNEVFHLEGQPVLSEREVFLTARPQDQPATVAALSPADEAMKKAIADSVQRQLEGGNRSIDPMEVVRQVMAMMQEANKASLEIATKQVAPAPAAVDPMLQLTSIITALKTLGLIGQQHSLKDMIEELRTLGLIQAPVAPAPAQNPITMLKDTLTAIKDFRELSGEASNLSGEGGGASGLVELAKAIPSALKELPAVLDKVRDMRGGRAPELGAAPAALPNAAVVTPAPGAPGFVAAGAPPAAPPAPVPQAAEVVSGFIRARMVQLFQSGAPGDAVAEWLDTCDPNFAGQLGALSPEILTQQVIAKDPILRVAMGDPRLPQFVESFLSYFKSEEEDGAPVGAARAN